MGKRICERPFELERLLALTIGFTGTIALIGHIFARSGV
jgi:hypothetical protein